MLKILVAIEGSESCSKVAQKAQELALLCKGDVTFLTIVSPDFKLVTSKEKLEAENKKLEMKKAETEEALETCSMVYGQCELVLGEKGLKTKRVVKEGNYPAEDIVEYADENDFDLLVIADKGSKKLKNKLLGSTTEKIVRHAKTSVLVVK
ncbi:MAG: universal stress protein [Bacillota bacterium]|jgi:nucleotide-binding universal stress UspA family protein